MTRCIDLTQIEKDISTILVYLDSIVKDDNITIDKGVLDLITNIKEQIISLYNRIKNRQRLTESIEKNNKMIANFQTMILEGDDKIAQIEKTIRNCDREIEYLNSFIDNTDIELQKLRHGIGSKIRPNF